MYKGSPGYRIRQEARYQERGAVGRVIDAIYSFLDGYRQRGMRQKALKEDIKAQQRQKKESDLRKLLATSAIISLIGGIFFFISHYLSSQIQLSPGASLLNGNLLTGIILIAISLALGLSLMKKK